MARSKTLAPVAEISRAIAVLRGHKVLLDTDLAALYGVITKRFNEQIRRNRERFPEDFMFQLTAEEAAALRSQYATSKPSGRGGRRHHHFLYGGPQRVRAGAGDVAARRPRSGGRSRRTGQ
ncbi:MAG: ORF6N domain-containing protein [Steroidobacteraceae bacterium]